MYKNPRGSCLIVNVYNINGAIRRWSDLDVKLLSDLFRQLFFRVFVYSDFNGDSLTAENFLKILKDFSQMKEHADAQCCAICLMSHGEEGSLTVQDGKKVCRIEQNEKDFLFFLRFFMITSLICSATPIVPI